MPQSTSSRSFVRRTYEQIYIGRRRIATGAAVVLALGLGYHVVFGQNGLTVYEQKREAAVALEKDLGSLQHENESLKAHVERLQSDPSAIEHQAREELHYTKPGEVIYTLPTVPNTGKPVALIPTTASN